MGIDVVGETLRRVVAPPTLCALCVQEERKVMPPGVSHRTCGRHATEMAASVLRRFCVQQSESGRWYVFDHLFNYAPDRDHRNVLITYVHYAEAVNVAVEWERVCLGVVA
jgi:hypothetical protein